MTKNEARWVKAYFHWLAEQSRPEGHQHKTYWDVLWVMHAKEFVWLIPNDDNRIVDGLDLRREFLTETEAPPSIKTEIFGPCSVLEVMIALSRRMAFTAGGEAEGWAWQMMINLGLERMNDPLGPRKRKQAGEILDGLIWRTYGTDGTGSFFPLAWPEGDQTKVELWYQMQQYVMEIHPRN